MEPRRSAASAAGEPSTPRPLSHCSSHTKPSASDGTTIDVPARAPPPGGSSTAATPRDVPARAPPPGGSGAAAIMNATLPVTNQSAAADRRRDAQRAKRAGLKAIGVAPTVAHVARPRHRRRADASRKDERRPQLPQAPPEPQRARRRRQRNAPGLRPHSDSASRRRRGAPARSTEHEVDRPSPSPDQHPPGWPTKTQQPTEATRLKAHGDSASRRPNGTPVEPPPANASQQPYGAATGRLPLPRGCREVPPPGAPPPKPQQTPTPRAAAYAIHGSRAAARAAATPAPRTRQRLRAERRGAGGLARDACSTTKLGDADWAAGGTYGT